MIAPVHLASGALIQRVGKRWYLWLPLAFLSHQVLDWTNGHIFHEAPDASNWPFTVLSIVGALAVVWYGRRQWAGMTVAILPDIIDHVPNYFHWTTRAEWLPVHRWFWSARWQQPEWALAWMAVALVIVILILKGD